MAKKPSNKVKMTAMEKELARVNYEAMQRYQKMYMPMEAGFVKDVLNSERGSTKQAMNEAAGSSQFAFERTQPTVEQGLGASGTGTDSGRGIFGRAGVNADLATSRAANVTGASGAAKDAYYRNLGTLVAQGKGQEVQALQTGTQAAGLANKQAILDAQASQAARMARNQLVGTAAGYGLGYGVDRLSQPQAPISTWAGRNQNTGMGLAGYEPNPQGPYLDESFGVAPNFNMGQ